MQTSFVQSCAGQRWMRGGGAAVWAEASEKEAQQSSCSTSYTGLRACTCVLAASAERAVARLVELCLFHCMFNGTKQESSCCPPAPSSAKNWQWCPCLIHRKGKGKASSNPPVQGMEQTKPTLNNLQKSPFCGNGCFQIFVLETAAASHRVWVSVLVLAVHAGSESQA